MSDNLKEKLLESLKSFNLKKLELKDVPTIYVRPMSVTEITSARDLDASKQMDFAIRSCVCDESGTRIFDNDDKVADLFPWDVALQILELAGGDKEEDQNEVMGKSGETHSSESSSS